MPCSISNRTPKQDGFFMPAEFSPIRQVWMLWPERPDNWRDGAKPAQAAYARVAAAVARFAEVTVGVSCAQYENCRAKLPPCVRVVEISSNDAWKLICQGGITLKLYIFLFRVCKPMIFTVPLKLNNNYL